MKRDNLYRICAAFLLLCMLPALVACTGAGAAAPEGTAAASGQSGQSAAQKEAEADEPPAADDTGASGAAAIKGVENTRLRQVCWQGMDAMVDGGFFSIGEEVMPEETYNGNFRYGARLYYNDIATRQSRPLHVPGSPGGYLNSQDWPGTVSIFTTRDKLVIINEGSVETMNFDLTGRKTVYVPEEWLVDSFFTDGTYLYIGEFSGGMEDTMNSVVTKLDLATGEGTRIGISVPDEDPGYSMAVPRGTLGGDLVMVADKYDKDAMQASAVRFSLLDVDTRETRELYTAEADESGMAEYFVTADRFFWRSFSELDGLHMYDPATKEATKLEFSGTPYFYSPETAWDNKLPVRARYEDMGGYDWFYADLATGETAPLGARVETDYTSYLEKLDILAETGDQYVICPEYAKGDMWKMDDAGKVEKADAPPDGDENLFAMEGFARDYAPVYALIDKDDYWAGNVNYLPFTIMVA